MEPQKPMRLDKPALNEINRILSQASSDAAKAGLLDQLAREIAQRNGLSKIAVRIAIHKSIPGDPRYNLLKVILINPKKRGRGSSAGQGWDRINRTLGIHPRNRKNRPPTWRK